MNNIKVVIGANFGDEGKGLMTNYFCHQSISNKETCINVLTNGGAQRAHTVDLLDGTRHIFQHFGSGTMSGAVSYLAKFYIINVMQFRKEYMELMSLNVSPIEFYDYRCKWSTPWDMLVNQIVEYIRDDNKHGSCGMGIWETLERYNKIQFIDITTFNSLPRKDKKAKLIYLRDTYFINRLKNYGCASVPNEYKDIFYSDLLIENFLSDIEFFCKNAIQCTSSIIKNYDSIVFENGQGLLLDEKLTTFYGNNLTPSSTGALDAKLIIDEVFGKEDVNVELCYVSRTYMTRHGAGKFVTECKKDNINKDMFDKTNVTNEFQGGLRYGELVIPQLIKRIDDDSKFISNAKVSLALTHTNEFNVDVEQFKYNMYLSNNKTIESVDKLK